MKSFLRLGIILLSFFILGCGKLGTYPLSIQYQPAKELFSLKEKIGPTLGIAPFQDLRPETHYIGTHTSIREVTSYFKSEPFPLEKAISDSLQKVLAGSGVKVVSIPRWDGKPDSLKEIEADSALYIEIRRFWAEGRATLFGTKLRSSIHLVIHLGVKKEGKVFTRSGEMEKEGTLARLTPAKVEEVFNQMLTDLFDSFFSNPY